VALREVISDFWAENWKPCTWQKQGRRLKRRQAGKAKLVYIGNVWVNMRTRKILLDVRQQTYREYGYENDLCQEYLPIEELHPNRELNI
jgi:hypothetical protein